MKKFQCLYENYGASNLTAPVYPLLIAVHLCQKFNFPGKNIVRRAMQLIVDHSSDGSCWFNFLSPFGNIRELHLNTLYPYQIARRSSEGVFVGEWITETHLSTLEYFLNNGRDVRSEGLGYLLGLPESHVRFTELPIKHRYFGHVTPLTLASLTGHPKGVLLLVRYGASPLYPTNQIPIRDSLRSPWFHPLHSLLNQLNLRAVDGEIQHLSLSDQDHLPFTSSRGISVTQVRQRKLLICLLYMLRVVPHPPVRIAHENQQVTREMKNGIGMLKSVYTKWIEQPFDMAPSLQHLCRCSIREAIKEAQQLPHGIQKLPVPEIVKNYLDLTY